LDELVAVQRLGDSHGCELDAHDLQLGRELRAIIGGIEIALRDMVGEDFSLLPQGRDKAVNLAAMLGAFAHGIDIRIIDGAHMVVDDNGALDGKPGAQADLGIGPDPCGDHQHVAGECRAVLECEARYAIIAEHRGCALLEMDGHAQFLHA
jgi:hypothetical protein